MISSRGHPVLLLIYWRSAQLFGRDASSSTVTRRTSGRFSISYAIHRRRPCLVMLHSPRLCPQQGGPDIQGFSDGERGAGTARPFGVPARGARRPIFTVCASSPSRWCSLWAGTAATSTCAPWRPLTAHLGALERGCLRKQALLHGANLTGTICIAVHRAGAAHLYRFWLCLVRTPLQQSAALDHCRKESKLLIVT